MDAKTQMWLDAGARLVLVADIDGLQIAAHHDDGSVARYGIGDPLVRDPVLPGFTCPVADIFHFGPRRD